MPALRLFRLATILYLIGAAAAWIVYLFWMRGALAAEYDGGVRGFAGQLVRWSREKPLDYYLTRSAWTLGYATLMGGGLLLLARCWWRTQLSCLAFAAGGILICLLPAFIAFDDDLVRRMIYREGSVVDALTAWAFFFAGITMLAGFARQSPRRPWLLAFAALFIVCAGEEASWGQHVFHYGTPKVVKATNTQGELNLHNLFDSALFNAVFLMEIGLFYFVCVAARRRPHKTPAYLRMLFAAAALYFLAGAVVPRKSGQEFRHWTFGIYCATAGLLALTSPMLFGAGRTLRRVFDSVIAQVRFPAALGRCACVLMVTYVVTGLRFLNLGDLGIPYDSGYEPMIDDEVGELYGGVLALMLAAAQRQKSVASPAEE
jgi:hypothetical protein